MGGNRRFERGTTEAQLKSAHNRLSYRSVSEVEHVRVIGRTDLEQTPPLFPHAMPMLRVRSRIDPHRKALMFPPGIRA